MDNKIITSLQNLLAFFFSDATPYTASLTQLCFSTASVSHPIPLSAANHFSL